eukprot:gnl/TRDRNA2_/TRDRNA2_197569_c0_seq1.p1 gnl/TRDRNA2_/TRDRNA2_197569_c0~~gnl/TRDRNA2_/TRDRNA2_197569_c0_seq1.p1  ORF type:complete len:452 (-),score=77.71 gnl/TRDRNA2_/TRDRNA2_197569_c0_seq1:94-1449(-)
MPEPRIRAVEPLLHDAADRRTDGKFSTLFILLVSLSSTLLLSWVTLALIGPRAHLVVQELTASTVRPLVPRAIAFNRIPHSPRGISSIPRIRHTWQPPRQYDWSDRLFKRQFVTAAAEQEGPPGEIQKGDEPNMEVRWATMMDPTEADSEPSNGSLTMPIFPLGQTYFPYTSPVLVIFEPRYRAMYNDILFSGARRFMVCNIDRKTGRLAETGAILYLDELKEVSEQTADKVKYIGQHTVIGRGKLVKVLNPRASTNRSTYLRAEVVEVDDEQTDVNSTEPEGRLRQLFEDLVDVQEKLGEEPRFSQEVKARFNFTKGTGKDDRGLWGAIVLWQTFLEQRGTVIQQRMQREIQNEVFKFFFNSTGGDMDSLAKAGKQPLPEPLSLQINAIQRKYSEEYEAMNTDPEGLMFQNLLQSEAHNERLEIFMHMIDKERKRLGARLTLKNMFKGMS